MELEIVENANPIATKSENNNTSEKNNEAKEDLFMNLLMGKDVIGKVETSRGEFKVKFPKAKDKMNISKLMSIHRGGLPVSSFDVASEDRNLMCSTLDIVVVSGPTWLDEVKAKNKNFSFEEVPDDEFLLELFQKAHVFFEKVQSKFSKKEKSKVRELPSTESVDENVDDGLFAGVSGGTD